MPLLACCGIPLWAANYSSTASDSLVMSQLLCTGSLRTGSSIPARLRAFLPACTFARNYPTLSGNCTKTPWLALAHLESSCIEACLPAIPPVLRLGLPQKLTCKCLILPSILLCGDKK